MTDAAGMEAGGHTTESLLLRENKRRDDSAFPAEMFEKGGQKIAGLSAWLPWERRDRAAARGAWCRALCQVGSRGAFGFSPTVPRGARHRSSYRVLSPFPSPPPPGSSGRAGSQRGSPRSGRLAGGLASWTDAGRAF